MVLSDVSMMQHEALGPQYEEFPSLETESVTGCTSMQRLGAKLGWVPNSESYINILPSCDATHFTESFLSYNNKACNYAPCVHSVLDFISHAAEFEFRIRTAHDT